MPASTTTNTTPYSRLPSPPQTPTPTPSISTVTPAEILRTFVLMALAFSANHGSVVSCLSLSSSRLGDLSYLNADLGTWQSGTLYITYTLSAVFGAAYIVSMLGERNGLVAGVGLYCVYVSCFLIAAIVEDSVKWRVAITGAAIGGVGGGFLWTAQGAYFGRCSEAYAKASKIPTSSASSYLGGIFAFFYLSLEVFLKLLSTFIITYLEWSWKTVFLTYTIIAITSAFTMLLVHDFPRHPSDTSSSHSLSAICYKLTSAVRILKTDPKMKYMIPMNAVFGFAASFLTAYVIGQVLPKNGLADYTGVLTAIPAGTAAILSLVLGSVSKKLGKGVVLIFGACSFAALAMMFILKPGLDGWTWSPLIAAFFLMGCGRATFESTLRATFVDFFPSDLPGAFANIILQSGLFTSLGFFLFPHLDCEEESDYCVKYKDGTLHDVLALEVVVVGTAVLAIFGYLRASYLFRLEQEGRGNEALLYDDGGYDGNDSDE